MFPQTTSSKTTLLRGLGLMLGATAVAAGGLHMAAEGSAGVELQALPLWVSAGLSGALVASLGSLLAWPVLRRSERLSVDNRTALAELERHRRTDPGTGLPNRRQFDRLLEQSLAVARRHDFEVGLLLLRLDGWQRSSLRLDPADADAILREIGTLTSRNLRAGDSIARIGSETLAVIVGRVEDRAALVTLAERIVARVEKVAARHAEAELSCAPGIAVASPGDGLCPLALIRLADEALAEAESDASARLKVRTGPDRAGEGRLSLVR